MLFGDSGDYSVRFLGMFVDVLCVFHSKHFIKAHRLKIGLTTTQLSI